MDFRVMARGNARIGPPEVVDGEGMTAFLEKRPPAY
jgi:hypothetical protein